MVCFGVIQLVFLLSCLYIASPDKRLSNLFPENIDQFIESINKAQNTWIAGKEFLTDLTIDDIKVMVALRPTVSATNKRYLFFQYPSYDYYIPNYFNCWDRWPECRNIINHVPEYGHPKCVAGWALAFIATLSDRLCIFSDGEMQTTMSAMDLMNCCKNCFSGYNNCGGGDSFQAWQYWINSGLVSEKCKPYWPSLVAQYGCMEVCYPNHERLTTALTVRKPTTRRRITKIRTTSTTTTTTTPKPAPTTKLTTTPVPRIPTDKPRKKSTIPKKDRYEEEKRMFRVGKRAYMLPKNSKQIQYEIHKNGPVQAGIKLYEDILTYRDGVYVQTKGQFLGYHSVVIIGWGTEKTTPYWLVVNPWGHKFGNNGTIKILRGKNHIGIEENIVAGEPQTVRSAEIDNVATERNAGTANKSTTKASSGSVETKKLTRFFFLLLFCLFIT